MSFFFCLSLTIYNAPISVSFGADGSGCIGCVLEPRRQGDPKTGGLEHPGASTAAAAARGELLKLEMLLSC